MPKRPCLVCGALTDGRSYCPEHQPARRRSPSSKRTGTAAFSRLRPTVYLRDGGLCQLCGGRVDQDDYHVDHLVPVSEGGKDDLDNLRLTHPDCNMSKGACA